MGGGGRRRGAAADATFNNGMPWNVLGYYQQFGHARRAFDLASELLVEQLVRKPDKSVATSGARAQN